MSEQPEKLDLRSMDISEEKKQELLTLFPEIRTEGDKIDFNRLKLALGEMVDSSKERYGMNWPGKADCFRAIQTPSTGTLLPCPEESVDFDATENLILEGDNLEILKLLQKSYLGKVKMIYIDPPYNTGNDFVYPDDFSDNMKNYLQYTGQVDSEGKKFSTNSDTDGRFHSNWMNMMYPRLYLARNLLRDDGVIFISIDDNEVTNLRRICDEIFGEENFFAAVSWHKNYASANDSKKFSNVLDYLVIYSKSISFSRNLLPRTDKQNSLYKYDDNDGMGPWRPDNLSVKTYSKDYDFPIVNPITKISYNPPKGRCWVTNEDTIKKWIAEKRIFFGQKGDGAPQLKRYLIEVQDGIVPTTYWSYDDCGHNDESRKEIKELFDNPPFDTPKPTRLLKQIIQISNSKDSIILDFFAGSGTTAQAVLDFNHHNTSNQKFILIQLPEPTEREDYSTIAEITKERVRRVIKKLNDEDAGKLPLDGPQDRGFRVFKLAQSNFTPWDGQAAKDAPALEEQLALHINHIHTGRSQDDILYELLLKSGYSLTTPVEKVVLEGKTVYQIAGGEMLICLEKELTMEVIRAMAALHPQRVICLDAGFDENDQLKANAVQIFRTAEVPSFKTV